MNRKDLQFLKSLQKYPSVSILVKTHRGMPGAEKDPIAVKNGVAEAKERLLKEFSARDMKKLFENLDALVAGLDYTKSTDGLALFANEDVKLAYALPFAVQHMVTIDSTFAVRDILRELTRIPHYWVLSLSEKPTRLFYGLGDTLTEVVEPVADVLGISRDGFPLDYIKPEKPDESRIMTGKSPVAYSPLSSKYEDEHKKAFFQKVDKLLERFVGVDHAPLFVVGVEHSIAMYKDLSKHQITDILHGDYVRQTIYELSQAIAPVVKKYLADERRKKLDEYTEAVGKIHHAFGIDKVWKAACEGRIKDLLVEETYTAFVVINKENESDIMLAGDPRAAGVIELVNMLIEKVSEKGGGKVTFFKKDELKDKEHVAAILRY